MRRVRELKLRKETLTELVPGDLHEVAGGSGPSCAICPTACTSCASDFQQCVTGGCVTSVLNCGQTVEPNC